MVSALMTETPHYFRVDDEMQVSVGWKKGGVYGRGTEAISVRSARAFTFTIPWEIV